MLGGVGGGVGGGGPDGSAGGLGQVEGTQSEFSGAPAFVFPTAAASRPAELSSALGDDRLDGSSGAAAATAAEFVI